MGRTRITSKQKSARRRNIKVAQKARGRGGRKSRNSVTTKSFLKKARAHGVSLNSKFKKSVSKLSIKDKRSGIANMSKLIRVRR